MGFVESHPCYHVPVSCVMCSCCLSIARLPSFKKEPGNLNFKWWSLQNKTVSGVEAPDCWLVIMWLSVWRVRGSWSGNLRFQQACQKLWLACWETSPLLRTFPELEISLHFSSSSHSSFFLLFIYYPFKSPRLYWFGSVWWLSKGGREWR